MVQAKDAVGTISGVTATTDARPAGEVISETPRRSPRGRGAATVRTTPLGTAAERLAILMQELGNCQKAGVKIRWAKSQTKPRRILLAIYEATLCPKCSAFLLIEASGMVKCQTPGCELAGVEYMPDELPDVQGNVPDGQSQMPDTRRVE